MRKIYTAFISSAFKSLRAERNAVINSLMNFRVVPVGMEHFTVTTSGQFSDIEELIDESDIFILLLGREYGSCDKDGISWTEKEYNYALEKNKPIIALICDELSAVLKKASSELTEDEQKQVEFCNKISFARTVTDEFDIKTIIMQSIGGIDFSKCIGWTRIEYECLSEKELLKWCEEHKLFDISGKWYHVHLSDDKTYIRVGTVNIFQDFTPNKYLDLYVEGENYNVDYYDKESETLYENEMESSHFVGEYKLKENGNFSGLFNSTRAFKGGRFNAQEVADGTRRGIHDFKIKSQERINGEFHDEAPSPKFGKIFLFRDEKERNKFLLGKREENIKQR